MDKLKKQKVDEQTVVITASDQRKEADDVMVVKKKLSRKPRLPFQSVRLVCNHGKIGDLDVQELIQSFTDPKDTYNRQYSKVPPWEARLKGKYHIAVLLEAKMEQEGKVPDQLATDTTARIGDLKCLRWLVDNGYAFRPMSVAFHAVQNDHLAVVQWVVEEYYRSGVILLFPMLETAIDFNTVQSFQWLFGFRMKTMTKSDPADNDEVTKSKQLRWANDVQELLLLGVHRKRWRMVRWMLEEGGGSHSCCVAGMQEQLKGVDAKNDADFARIQQLPACKCVVCSGEQEESKMDVE